MKHEFTKYEIARIIGARALQIAMDAPLLLKVSEEELREMKYDSLRIAERELEENVLPINIRRPIPLKRSEKLRAIKQEELSDEELLAKAQEVEKELVKDAKEIGLINESEDEDEDSLGGDGELAKEE